MRCLFCEPVGQDGTIRPDPDYPQSSGKGCPDGPFDGALRVRVLLHVFALSRALVYASQGSERWTFHGGLPQRR
ncbi:hypothetical protein ACVWXN_002687 [Bradyrhizobium sp. i1.4.4]